jgi:septum formation protein
VPRTGNRDRVVRSPVLVLASASPRRAEILSSLGIAFRVLVSGRREALRPREDARSAVRRLALEKAQQVFSHAGGLPVLAADTLVYRGAQIFGKPTGRADAAKMLTQLSGRVHDVATAVCLITPDTLLERTAVSQVRFAALSKSEIDWYTATQEPLDKAGAYAVQGLGARFIEEIRGSYSNVVGLPARAVYEMLLEAGLSPLALPAPRPASKRRIGPRGGR